MSKLKAHLDNLIVKLSDSKEQKYGNIVVPDLGKEQSLIAEVIDVGPGRMEFNSFITPTIKIGDTVYLPPIGAIKIEYEREEYFVIQEKLVLAFIPKEIT